MLHALLTLALPLVGNDLTLRGGRPTPPEPIHAVGMDGVTVGSEGGVVVGWDIIAELPAGWIEPSREWAALADDLWRSRARLERGDFALAERTLEPWLPRVRGRTGPTAMLVGDALLRCRLRRGARTSAVDAWLVWLAAGQNGPTLYLDSGRPAPSRVEDPALVPDAALGLVPDLPPMWLDIPPVRALAEAPVPEGDTPAALMGLAFRISAASECGLQADLTPLLTLIARPAPSPGDPQAMASRLVASIVVARAGDSRQRESARMVLAGLNAMDERPWVEAWRRAAMGRSLLREGERERRLEGVLEMLHVPARLGEASPYLTGLVLAEAAVALRDLGEHAAAERLYQEFASLGGGHAAWAWGPIREWGRSSRASHLPPSPPNPNDEPPDTGVPPP